MVTTLQARPLVGLGADPKLIRSIIKDNATLLAKWDSLTVGPPGNRSGHNQYTSNSGIDDNIINSTIRRNSPDGTSKQKGLHVLGQKRPDLLEEVKAGLKTTHQANVEAGFRPRRPTRSEAGHIHKICEFECGKANLSI
jgi:hypothetical protein